MKILDVKELAMPEIKVIKFARFTDHRGYFTETYRWIDFTKELYKTDIPSKFVQANETWSRAGTFRGLHFQWNPYMGKLVRCITGHLIDYVLDIRLKSPTFGYIIGYDMPTEASADFSEWIWVPSGFAHGTLLTKTSLVEYFCTGGYNADCEAGISPLDNENFNWTLCEYDLMNEFKNIVQNSPYLTDKDKQNPSLRAWQKNKNAKEFIYEEVSSV